MADETVEEIVVDGEVIDLDDFTFREQREMKAVIRNHILGGEDVDIDELALAEFLPAAIFIFKRRANPAYTLDEAMDLKAKDVIQERKAATNGSRPTKPRAKTTRAKST